MTLRTLHRSSATLIALFAFAHIANHLAGLAGVATHLAFMESTRLVYRNPVVEIVLLLCVAFQVGSGLTLALRGWRLRRGFVPWLQALSGVYLSFFLLVHVSAILSGRVLLNLDTNFYFAAAGFHVPPYPFFFVPYYFLAVVALFGHLGCAAYWQVQHRPGLTRVLVIAIPTAVAAVVALLIVLLLAGKLQPFEVPAKYKATYGAIK